MIPLPTLPDPQTRQPVPTVRHLEQLGPMDGSTVGFYLWRDGRIIYANMAAARLLGTTVERLAGQTPAKALPAACIASTERLVATVLTTLEQQTIELSWRAADGTVTDIRVTARFCRHGDAPCVSVSLFDITELKDALRAAVHNAEMLEHAELLCRAGSFEFRAGVSGVRLSRGLVNLLGLEPGVFSHRKRDILPMVPEAERAFVSGIWAHAIAGEPFDFQHRIQTTDGRLLTVVQRGLVESDGRGFGLLQDVSSQLEADQRIEQLATHHEVTGLKNRGWLLEQLDEAIGRTAYEPEPVGLALLAIELPRIADLKANMGFGAGDALSTALAARLKSLCRPEEQLGHLGDTEFGVIVPTAAGADRSGLRERARVLQRALQIPVRIGHTDVVPTCVIGIACHPADGDRAEVLAEHAQMARLEASDTDSVGFHSAEAAARARRALTIESALSQALERGELQLHYQAQVSLDRGTVRGAEALLRWQSPELGLVSPAEFVPIAERAGLSNALGDWVIDTACRQIGAWRRQGLPPLRVAVNLAASQLRQPGLAQRIESLLVQHGASPTWFGVEVTESCALSEVEHAIATLRELKSIGVEISLDDFGTGFSSLSYLTRLPIDVVKIDRSFLHDVTADAQDASVTRTIISMAHGLQMRALAEGVETEGQLALLAAAGCDDCQGYWFGRPVPAAEFEALLAGPPLLPERYVRRSAERPRTLLLVDDEANVLSSLKRLFRRDGYRILTASSAEEGLRCLGENEVDVIISDQRMPGMTGVEFLRRAHETYPETFRLVLSGYTELQSVIDAVNAGAIYRFLTKPWEDDRLRAHVAEAFRAKELADENRRLAERVDAANVELAALNDRLAKTLEQQRGQSELLAANADHLREMLIELPLPVFGLGDDRTLAFVNREAERLLPGAPALLGSATDELLPVAALAAPGDPTPRRRACRIAGRQFDVVARSLPGADPASAERPQLLILIPDGDAVAEEFAA